LNPKPRYVPLRVLSSVSPVSSDLHHRASKQLVLSISRSTTPSKTPFSHYTLTRNIPQTVLYKHQSTRLKSFLPIFHKNHTPVSQCSRASTTSEAAGAAATSRMAGATAASLSISNKSAHQAPPQYPQSTPHRAQHIQL